jgi:hypothetical protein
MTERRPGIERKKGYSAQFGCIVCARDHTPHFPRTNRATSQKWHFTVCENLLTNKIFPNAIDNDTLIVTDFNLIKLENRHRRVLQRLLGRGTPH